mgnify:CR=1 FL=1|tara:strand:- start:510 stop:1445 length:936 start_codon:yes stop_codon:yes gene_type:complete
MKVLVLKTTGNIYTVRKDNGTVLECRLKGKFRNKDIKSTNPIVVGDYVYISKYSDDWMIEDIEERKNFLSRKSVNLSKQSHILAANIDQVILIITLKHPVTTTAFIDRFLVGAHASNIDVVLLFNKVDLYDSLLLEKKDQLEKVYQLAGYKTLSISILNNDVSVLKNIMKSKINLISGHSGVGKSTLINKLQPGLDINTNIVSETHSQGQHTTTYSQLYKMDFGGYIIDTPGIKGFGLSDILIKDICNLFPEFYAISHSCKYYNCIHHNEPDCAIKSAVKSGSLSKSRYNNYLSMISESNDDVYRKEENKL